MERNSLCSEWIVLSLSGTHTENWIKNCSKLLRFQTFKIIFDDFSNNVWNKPDNCEAYISIFFILLPCSLGPDS